ncbi:acetyl-CoA synthetase-like protein [Ceraceosorus guamensis]|uniref:Acetyl-CoA synthetase-like protein n=1 Tax=Ceraceosorus guamensis TaxID=1522189 RepID=A0A316W8I5_9BASI|nr:acetyl-CoA synthetase-like protein [Ceraceosorus guamensis]PWN46142.1 acetyl-CoA synthetase-like protein [Ceraceosorus guamensis]
MTIFKSSAPSVGRYPDDIDLYGFMFEHFPEDRPDPRGRSAALLIDDDTGAGLTFEQVKDKVDLLSVGLQQHLGIQDGSSVGIFSPNSVHYPIALWASHRIGAVVSAANPAFQPDELAYQIDAAKCKALFVGYENRQAGFAAAQRAGIPKHHVVLICDPAIVANMSTEDGGRVEGAWTIEGLIAKGREEVKAKGETALKNARAPKLSPGQARKKLAFLSFSSGTTGLPKGVAIAHSSPIANVLQTGVSNGVSIKPELSRGRFRPYQDVSLGVLPFYHIYGLVVVLHFTFYYGIPNVCVPKFKGIEPMLRSCIRYNISTWWLVPPQVVLLCKDPAARQYHEQIVHFIMIGAAPLSDDLSRQLDAILPGLDWGQGYGMTETCTVTLMHPLDTKPVLGSAGRLISDTEAKVVTPEGKECAINERGELWIRAPQNTLGYFNNAQATKEMFLEGNWVRTGDEVYFDEQQNVFITDRIKELIKVKGFQVAPAELEGWILNHADVRDCGVIGLPDESAGESPCAFIALSADAAQRCQGAAKKGEQSRLKALEAIKESVIKHVADHKVRYKHLGRVEIVDTIPATASGKILRRELRELGKKLSPLRPQSKL